MTSRRDFILRTAGAGGVLVSNAFKSAHGAEKTYANEKTAQPLRVLFLGGTGFIGRHYVKAALERGHTVSVFSRGRKAADLPASVEQLIGDRDGDLSAIEGRDWDAVFDLATYVPRWVRTLGAALGGRVKHYTFISTIMVYPSPGGADEQSELEVYTGGEDPYSLNGPGKHYGALKVLCER